MIMQALRGLAAATVILHIGVPRIALAQTTGVGPIRVTAPDGVSLVGTVYTPSSPGPGIVLFHMCDGNGREAWDGLARGLMNAGFHVLTMNYRGIGGSGGERLPRTLKHWETKWAGDADAAVGTLASRPGVDAAHIGIGGASCGVTMSLLAARLRPAQIRALVLLAGPYSDASRSFVAVRADLPVFAAASREDSLGAVWMEAIAKASKHAASKSIIYRDAGHGTEMLTREPALSDSIVKWFRTHLRPGARTATPTPGVSLVGAAFDEDRKSLVIAGGYSSGATSLETWEWNARGWIKAATGGPSVRNEPSMTYDRRRKRIVLFGGDRGREGSLGDTWAWDGRTWQLLTMDGPSPRSAPMVYDARRDRIVLFGGGSSSGKLYNDTWEWDGTRWQRVIADSSAGSPPARALHGLAYDEKRGRVVLAGGFGGFDVAARKPTTFDDTWEWDGTSWRKIDISGPGPRDHVAMTYSPRSQAVVLHAGGRPDVGLLGDTWTYDGSRWTKVVDNGPARGRHRMTPSDDGSITMFGGWAPANVASSELWSFADGAWKRLSPP
jgi:dienelactone hydrolase